MKRKILMLTIAAAAVALGVGVLNFPHAKASPAPYTTTITNFDPAARQATRFDVNGDAIDAHDGDMAYFEGKYYLYGTSYNCGYKLQVVGTPFCGFKSYSSTDLVNWTEEGYLFDATTPAWQASCAAPNYGCYRPHVLYNASTSKYVLWINGYGNTSGYHVFTASSPEGPFAEQAAPVLSDSGAPNTFVNGDMDLFQDDNGTAYIAYTNIAANHALKIQQLNADYTSGTGSAVSTGTTGAEAPSLIRRGATYYLVYAPTCTYCGGTSTQYKTTTNILGTWSASAQLNANSCGGQPSFVAKLPGVSGDNYLYGSDLWEGGNANQAKANYYWAPLSFSGTTISGFGCSNTVTLTLGDGAAGQPVMPAGADQSSGVSYYRNHCDISNTWSRLQSFTVGRSGVLSNVRFATFQSGNPNAGLRLDISHLDANGAPVGTPLYSITVPASSVGWSPRQVAITPNVTVYGGMQYGIVARSSTTSGCYGFVYNDYKPYQPGKELYQPFNGAWATESQRSLKFQTAVQ